MLGFMRLWCAYSGKHEKLERESRCSTVKVAFEDDDDDERVRWIDRLLG